MLLKLFASITFIFCLYTTVAAATESDSEYLKNIQQLEVMRESQLLESSLRTPEGPRLLQFNFEGSNLTPPPSEQMIRDLVHVEPDLDQYKSGRYVSRPRIYMFCRTSRQYPCLMIMKNGDGTIRYRENSNEVWSQPSLGLSSHGKTFEQTSGHTPSGVWRIDGVMPLADRPIAFGQYRRLILQFVEQSPDEIEQKKLLPPSSHLAQWWHEAVVARDNGRALFRIHGSGEKSPEGQSYFPLVPTSGCVAQRENTYNGITYGDQRLLLDNLMDASGLEQTYENEEKIMALLYVVNINDVARAVALEDLKNLGVDLNH